MIHRGRQRWVEVAGADEGGEASHADVEIVPVGDVEFEPRQRRRRQLFLDLAAQLVAARFRHEHQDQILQPGIVPRNQQMIGIAAGVADDVDQRRGGGKIDAAVPMRFDRVKLGGGLEAKAHRYAYSPTGAFPVVTGGTSFAANTAPAYARWDAMAAYEAKDWALRLNVKNVFDRLYWDAIYDNGGFAIPGPRRTIILTGEFKF